MTTTPAPYSFFVTVNWLRIRIRGQAIAEPEKRESRGTTSQIKKRKSMKKSIWKWSLIGILCVASACEKPGLYDNFVYQRDTLPCNIEVPKGFGSLEEFRNYAYKTYARALSLALKESNFRQWAKSQFLLQFDGDYDLLHVYWANKQVTAAKTYSECLADASGIPLSFFTEDLPKAVPRLNVCFPEVYDPEQWDAGIAIPQVTALPQTFQEAHPVDLPVYIQGVESGTCNSWEEPTATTLVVGESERVAVFCKPYGGGGAKIYFEDDRYIYLDGLDISDNQGEVLRTAETPIDPNALVRRGCQRDKSGKADKVWGVKFNNNEIIKSLEPWVRGKVEMYFKVIFNGSASNPKLNELTKYLPTFKRNSLKGGNWIDRLGIDIMRWEDLAGDYGNKMKYMWYERDGGKNVKIPISLEVKIKGVTSSLKTELWVGNDDDFAGESFVEYCDAVAWTGSMVGSDYNTGYISFNVRL